MQRPVAVCAFVLIVAAAGACGSSRATPMLVVGLGDSTPAGFGVGSALAFPVLYGELLAEDLGTEVGVANHATGETRTVAEWVSLITEDEDLEEDVRSADVVVMWMGWHDIMPIVHFGAAADWPAMQSQLITKNAEMAIAWNELFETIRELTPDATVLVADTGLVGAVSERFGSEIFWPEMERLAYLDWRDSLIDAADTHDAIVVPTWNDLQGEGREALHPEFSSSDGLHFNEAGQHHLAELFRRYDGITE